MSDSMIYFIVLLAAGILTLYLDKREDKKGQRDSDKDLVFGFICTSFMLLYIGFRLYNGVGGMIGSFPFIMFFAWGGLSLLLKSKKFNELLGGKRQLKLALVFTSILSIIIEIFSFVMTRNLGTIYIYSEADFKKMLLVTIFFIAYLTYLQDKRILKFILVEKDIWRKIFITSQIVFILIFIFGTSYNIKNTDKFDFYVDSEDYQETSGEELWDH